MKFLEETGSHGSFTVWGSGFRYEYNSAEHALNIRDPKEKRAYARLKFDSHLSRDPIGYVRYLDKANQIKALSFSNNDTINLTDIIDHSRIGAILGGTARSSYYAHLLELGDFLHFSDVFVEDTVLKSVSIKKFTSRDKSNSFYVGRITTVHDNTICARGCYLAGLMQSLSEKTLRDLMTLEFGDKFQHAAHELLRISAKLSSISAILDRDFVPEKRIEKTVNNRGENTFFELPL